MDELGLREVRVDLGQVSFVRVEIYTPRSSLGQSRQRFVENGSRRGGGRGRVRACGAVRAHGWRARMQRHDGGGWLGA